MGKECGAWVSRRLWGGGNTSPLKTTAWEANNANAPVFVWREVALNNIASWPCFFFILTTRLPFVCKHTQV